MHSRRTGLLLALALLIGTPGCGLLLDVSPSTDAGVGMDAEGPRPDASAPDATNVSDGSTGPEDAETEVDCADALAGTPCGEDPPFVCRAGSCQLSRCGDGAIDLRFEVCDDGNEVAGDGCEPGSCAPSCDATEDCPPIPCQVGTCVASACAYAPADDNTVCNSRGAVCASGRCGASCGDGVLDEAAGEQCDTGADNVRGSGCEPDCTYSCDSDEDCDDGAECNGLDFCDTDRRACRINTAGAVPCEHVDCQLARCAPGGCVYSPLDGDGDGFLAGFDPVTSVACGSDCNDANPDIHPGAIELVGNAVDEDCDGEIDETGIRCFADLDADGFGGAPGVAREACLPNETGQGGDCFDAAGSTAMSVHPGQTGFSPFQWCAPSASECSFDWNCDGFEEPQRQTLAQRCHRLVDLEGCASGSGWEGEVPACGESGTFVTCTGATILGFGFLCSATTATEQLQACR